MMIQNPVIPGMAPDPSILRVGATYYLATSTFHWTPGIQLFRSEDLANWELQGFGLTKEEADLRGTNTPAGIWAPQLSYDESSGRFWLIYSQMVNMSGREFNANTYAMWAESVEGPWSEPQFLTAIGFDPSLYHEAGRHYLAILEWETRTDYQAPGHIVIAEFDLEKGCIIGDWRRITHGFTTRGNAEAPQLYKREDYYYLIIAAGGTGYGHGVEIGRSRELFGPYEPHPSGEPILTSSPRHLFSLGNPDAGHFEMYNPHSSMQKAGHGSLVETPAGEWYMVHLMSRPLPGKLLNPLGRETALQQMCWTKAGWLELADGTNLAKMTIPAPVGIAAGAKINHDIAEEFAGNHYFTGFMTPYRRQTPDWVNTQEKPGHLRIYGGDSFFSRNEPAIMGTRATAFHYTFETAVRFKPDHYSERAGMGLYYDCNNWLFVHLAFCEETATPYLTLTQACHGCRTEYVDIRIPVTDEPVELKLEYRWGTAFISYRQETDWLPLREMLDVSYLSDEGVNGEPGEIGGFTGLFNFVGAIDAHQRDSYADFDYYRVTSQTQEN